MKIEKNHPQNNTKCTQKKNIFLPKAVPFVMWFHPISKKLWLHTTLQTKNMYVYAIKNMDD
jgi:hypothetical protein